LVEERRSSKADAIKLQRKNSGDGDGSAALLALDPSHQKSRKHNMGLN
jgi:hypothetical protein